ncbi:MAG TPA: hypothetical protein VE685_22095 [Thermoanaerobaculia bacterium]|jgi:hypothetical protein|nr:hypothetical protein [Thermoanaerobaculia bacterium]
MKKLKTFGFLLAASLSVAALQAQTLVYEGCWSPYPNCAGASDIYRDSSGRFWNCGRCGTTSNPNPATCRQVGNLYTIGYWCS